MEKRSGRTDDVLAAVIALGTGLDLDATLHQIVRSAAELVDARYGALGVLGEGGLLTDFIYDGIDDQTRELIGPLPTGHGLLGVVLEDPKPLRLNDISAHPASLGFPPGHPPMTSFLGVPVLARGKPYGRLYATEKRGGAAFTESDAAIFQVLANAAGTAIDNARLYDRTRQQRQALAATTQVLGALVDDDSPREALVSIAVLAAQLVDADRAVIAVTDNTGGDDVETLQLAAEAGEVAGAGVLGGSQVSLVDTIFGEVFRSGRAARCDPLPAPIGAGPDGVGSEPDLGPALILPLRGRAATLGLLILARPTGRPGFKERHEESANLFATQAALALERATERAARHELEVVADRERIARDLHDHVIQRIFAVGLAMQGTRRRAGDLPDVAERLDAHIDELQAVIQEIRTTIFDLHRIGPGGSLRAAVREIVNRLTEDSALRVSLRISGPIDVVGEQLAGHAQAVIHEAVSNVVRHAYASAMTVTVSAADELIIEVADDGVGIPDVGARSGLVGLADRAAALGGELSVTAPPGGGTRFVWSAPLPRV